MVPKPLQLKSIDGPTTRPSDAFSSVQESGVASSYNRRPKHPPPPLPFYPLLRLHLLAIRISFTPAPPRLPRADAILLKTALEARGLQIL